MDLEGYIVNIVGIVSGGGGSSVCRSPSGVTREPRRNGDQGTVESYDEERVRSATMDIPEG